MTEMDITYAFIRYISVAIRRQAKAFHNKYSVINYNENIEFIENLVTGSEGVECNLFSSNSLYKSLDDKLIYQELLMRGLDSLNETEKYVIHEKFINQRSDADIGKDFSISSQMISRKRRKIFGKLKHFFSI